MQPGIWNSLTCSLWLSVLILRHLAHHFLKAADSADICHAADSADICHQGTARHWKCAAVGYLNKGDAQKVRNAEGARTSVATFTPRKVFLVFICYRLSQPLGHSVARRIMSMKNFDDTIGNRTRGLLACSAAPQTTATPRTPHKQSTISKPISLRPVCKYKHTWHRPKRKSFICKT